MKRHLTDLCVRPGASVRDVMKCIDANATGIALLVDDQNKLITTISDGDIRRAILRGLSLDLGVESLATERAGSVPITAPEGSQELELVALMREHRLRQIPILSDSGVLTGFVTLEDLLGADDDLPVRAIIMAGGEGIRLRPLTNELPKPMLPLADRPLLEHMVGRIRSAGIQSIHMTTHYKPDVIKDHFGDGREFGISISYLDEDKPLGTAGSLGLLAAPDLDKHLLVINGDILTQINFRMLLDFHKEHEAAMTVVVKEYVVEVPYGVVETDGDGVAITSIVEKPKLRHFINAGIYLLNPEVCLLIPRGGRCDMTDLVSQLLAAGRRVISFPVREYWLDIGQKSDYARAQSDMAAGHV